MRNREQVPADLRACVTALRAHLADEDAESIKATSLDEFRTTAHFGLGMYIRNTFLLVENSPLAAYLKEKGVFHKDDMSSLILTALHNELTTESFDEDELVSRFASQGGYENAESVN